MPIERVSPVEGARVVDFDYAAAEHAHAWATRTLPRSLSDQAAPRRQAARDAGDGWEGHFREEFDRAEADLATRVSTAGGLGSVTLAGSITRAVDDANERQRRYNREHRAAEEAASAPTSVPGPTRPGP